MSTPTEAKIEPRKEDVVVPLEFEFSWWENGGRETRTISAESYQLACWKLGLLHQERFRLLGGVPKDFSIDLDDSQEPR